MLIGWFTLFFLWSLALWNIILVSKERHHEMGRVVEMAILQSYDDCVVPSCGLLFISILVRSMIVWMYSGAPSHNLDHSLPASALAPLYSILFECTTLRRA